MAEKKNKQKKNPIEDLLWDGEKILWMGKPNTSWSEYARLKPYPIDATVEGKIVYREESKADGCVKIWFMISFAISMGLLALMIDNGEYVDLMNDNIFIFVVIIILLMGAMVYVALFLTAGFLSLQKTLLSIGEPRRVWYAVTNKRLYVSVRWNTFYIMHFDLTKAIVEEGQFGSIITWAHKDLGRYQHEFPPFIGLNDFDVQEVLRLVNKHYLVLDLPVDDRREKKKNPAL